MRVTGHVDIATQQITFKFEQLAHIQPKREIFERLMHRLRHKRAQSTERHGGGILARLYYSIMFLLIVVK